MPSAFLVYLHDKRTRMKALSLLLILHIFIFANSIVLPENFQAKFTQKITNPKNKVINYSGKVLFSHKTLLKWEYLKPTKKEVCTNGRELLVVDHDLEQVSNYYINKGFNFTKILQNAKLHSPNIYVALYEGKQYTIQTDKRNRLRSVAYFDDLDNKVQIVFKNVRYGNKKISSNKMKCNYPKDYDIIRG